MSLVKICGLRRKCDIEYVNKYKPDFIGFVFAKSKRQVTLQLAKGLKAMLDSNIKAAGVFVNEPVEAVARICNEDIVDVIQLHGDENNEYIKLLRMLTDKPIIKAVRVQGAQQVLQAEMLDCDYLLLDAYKKSEYGGVGETFNWGLIPELKKPFFLAGGLNVGNIEAAIKNVQPYCVDLSSGAETDGFKDEYKIKAIIERVRRTK